MPGFSLLNLLKPFMVLVPEIEAPAPNKKIGYRTKLFWTGVSLLIFLVCSQLPLYGITSTKSSDPYYWSRVIMASNRGTLMELGISPIMTSSLIMQLLMGAGILKVDMSNATERGLFRSAQKLFGLVFTLGQAVIFVLNGMYGDVYELGWFNGFLIVLQLFLAAILVLLLDDILSKGYGFQGGISIFIACNTCETIVWKALSPTTVNYGQGPEMEGALVALFHYLFKEDDKIKALQLAFFRQHLPNITNLLATVGVFFVVVALENIGVDIKVKPKSVKGNETNHRIKLLYTSNMPVMLQSALFSNLFAFSQMLYGRLPNNLFIKLLGKWQSTENGQRYAVGGLAYLISPPLSMRHAIVNPVHTLLYISVITITTMIFGYIWPSLSNATANDVYQDLERQGLQVPGFDRKKKAIDYLNHYVPPLALVGGALTGILSVGADLMGAIGSGTGILLAVGMVSKIAEELQKDMN
eukprot:TRINITY_DN2911_c1_g4_i1.p1 TRINITY_DN2911_c1_g4~~TRINITY_DN2911_c1_g4_i1.p1  ORF type:complete len:469 (-),score=123.22 TRINITY_DN2911_c1_g4_i1:84-1490(-)